MSVSDGPLSIARKMATPIVAATSTVTTASASSMSAATAAIVDIPHCDNLLQDKLQLSSNTVDNHHHHHHNKRDVQILGHRGAIYQGVENTIEAFQSCLELDGCHGVELDVFRLKDDSLVVFHGTGGDINPGLLEHYCETKSDAHHSTDGDSTEGDVGDDDTSNSNKNNNNSKDVINSILDMTLEQVQNLSFVQESDHIVAPEEAITKANIPTLRQVLELIRQYPYKCVAIELKGEGTEALTIKLVEDLQMADQVILSSFHHSRISLVNKINPSIRTAAIFKGDVPDNYLQQATQVQADEIHLRYDTCSVERVQASHQRGFKVMAWFRGPKAMAQDIAQTYIDAVNEINVYKMVIQTGVDAICVNRPHCAVNLVHQQCYAIENGETKGV